MNRYLPVLSLFVAGLGWGTTGIFVRVLGGRGFSSFELLGLRLLVVFVLLLPILFWTFKNSKRNRAKLKTALIVSVLMLFYYLGAIVAVQNLTLVLAALLIGSSPLISWLLPLVVEWRPPIGIERAQGSGVLLGLLGLLGLALSKNTNTGTLENSFPMLGYLGGLSAAAVTVVNARILRAKQVEALPSAIGISGMTSFLGFLLSPLLLSGIFSSFFPGSIGSASDLTIRIQQNWSLIFGFGIFATLIPGLAIAYASSRLPPTTTSTVSIQLQVWTAILGWLILDERLSLIQIVSAISVVAGTGICVFWREPK